MIGLFTLSLRGLAVNSGAIQWIVLDFGGTRHNKTTNGHKKKTQNGIKMQPGADFFVAKAVGLGT